MYRAQPYASGLSCGKRQEKGLQSRGLPGFDSKLTSEKKKKLKTIILAGPIKSGYVTDFWTINRVRAVTKKELHIDLGYTRIWNTVLSLGFSCQKPERRARERNEKAITDWKFNTFPRLKKWAEKHDFTMGFQDESGISDKPFVRKTWALKGNTPHIQSCGGWKKITISGIIIVDPKNVQSKLFLRILTGTMTGENFLRFLKELKTHTKKRKLLLFVDGLPSHRSKKVKEYIKEEHAWLRVERFPGYARN